LLFSFISQQKIYTLLSVGFYTLLAARFVEPKGKVTISVQNLINLFPGVDRRSHLYVTILTAFVLQKLFSFYFLFFKDSSNPFFGPEFAAQVIELTYYEKY
jgi:hypothetical protein